MTTAASKQVHHQANGMVWVRSGGQNYGATLEDFAAAHGQPMPPLPAGAIERIYEPKRRHAIVGPTGVMDGGPMPWTFGDEAIANIDHLMSTLPVIPPPL